MHLRLFYAGRFFPAKIWVRLKLLCKILTIIWEFLFNRFHTLNKAYTRPLSVSRYTQSPISRIGRVVYMAFVEIVDFSYLRLYSDL